MGILTIHIDRNDYRIWQCIDVVCPAIAMAEYTSVSGHLHAIAVPYDPAFCRTKAHRSSQF